MCLLANRPNCPTSSDDVQSNISTLACFFLGCVQGLGNSPSFALFLTVLKEKEAQHLPVR